VVVLACGAMPATAQPARPARVPDDPRFARQWRLAHDRVMRAQGAWGPMPPQIAPCSPSSRALEREGLRDVRFQPTSAASAAIASVPTGR
jgi:hypothetical protein